MMWNSCCVERQVNRFPGCGALVCRVVEVLWCSSLWPSDLYTNPIVLGGRVLCYVHASAVPSALEMSYYHVEYGVVLYSQLIINLSTPLS